MDKTSINQRFDYLAPQDPYWGLHPGGAGTRLTPSNVPLTTVW